MTIEAVGEKGDGIARKQGFVLFVPGTKQGEEVRIRVSKVLAKVGFAEKIGAAEKKPATAAPKREEKPAEPDFDPQEELDSEDFGDEGSAKPAAEEQADEPDSGDSDDSADDGEKKD